jgi:hypothetical protein
MLYSYDEYNSIVTTYILAYKILCWSHSMLTNNWVILDQITISNLISNS